MPLKRFSQKKRTNAFLQKNAWHFSTFLVPVPMTTFLDPSRRRKIPGESPSSPGHSPKKLRSHISTSMSETSGSTSDTTNAVRRAETSTSNPDPEHMAEFEAVNWNEMNSNLLAIILSYFEEFISVPVSISIDDICREMGGNWLVANDLPSSRSVINFRPPLTSTHIEAAIHKYTQLTAITIDSIKLDQSLLPLFSKLPSLKSLSFSNLCADFSSLPLQLTSLDLSHTIIDKAGMKRIGEMTHLRHINLSGVVSEVRKELFNSTHFVSTIQSVVLKGEGDVCNENQFEVFVSSLVSLKELDISASTFTGLMSMRDTMRSVYRGRKKAMKKRKSRHIPLMVKMGNFTFKEDYNDTNIPNSVGESSRLVELWCRRTNKKMAEKYKVKTGAIEFVFDGEFVSDAEACESKWDTSYHFIKEFARWYSGYELGDAKAPGDICQSCWVESSEKMIHEPFCRAVQHAPMSDARMGGSIHSTHHLLDVRPDTDNWSGVEYRLIADSGERKMGDEEDGNEQNQEDEEEEDEEEEEEELEDEEDEEEQEDASEQDQEDVEAKDEEAESDQVKAAATEEQDKTQTAAIASASSIPDKSPSPSPKLIQSEAIALFQSQLPSITSVHSLHLENIPLPLDLFDSSFTQKQFPHLTSLHFISCSLTDAHIEMIVNRFPQLKTLDLKGNLQLSGVLQSLSNSNKLTSLELLNLGHCRSIPPAEFAFLPLQLTSLDVSHTRIDEVGMNRISEMTHLRRIDLSGLDHFPSFKSTSSQHVPPIDHVIYRGDQSSKTIFGAAFSSFLSHLPALRVLEIPETGYWRVRQDFQLYVEGVRKLVSCIPTCSSSSSSASSSCTSSSNKSAVKVIVKIGDWQLDSHHRSEVALPCWLTRDSFELWARRTIHSQRETSTATSRAIEWVWGSHRYPSSFVSDEEAMESKWDVAYNYVNFCMKGEEVPIEEFCPSCWLPTFAYRHETWCKMASRNKDREATQDKNQEEGEDEETMEADY